jgi:hypothetical protein
MASVASDGSDGAAVSNKGGGGVGLLDRDSGGETERGKLRIGDAS